MQRTRFCIPLLALLVLQGPAAWAAKPEWAGQGNGGGKPGKSAAAAPEPSASVDVRVGLYFGAQQRSAATQYYGAQQAKGKCPPGLAKKNNGCRPPGQAKKWGLGQPLSGDVVRYAVPNEVVVKIGLPPAGHRYVRVANDILLIAIGSMLVVDAIEDLMGAP